MNDREKIAELASLYIAHKHALDKLFDSASASTTSPRCGATSSR